MPDKDNELIQTLMRRYHRDAQGAVVDDGLQPGKPPITVSSGGPKFNLTTEEYPTGTFPSDALQLAVERMKSMMPYESSSVKNIGLMSPSDEARSTSNGTLAYYRPATKNIAVSGSQMLNKPVNLDGLLAHELTHAGDYKSFPVRSLIYDFMDTLKPHDSKRLEKHANDVESKFYHGNHDIQIPPEKRK